MHLQCSSTQSLGGVRQQPPSPCAVVRSDRISIWGHKFLGACMSGQSSRVQAGLRLHPRMPSIPADRTAHTEIEENMNLGEMSNENTEYRADQRGK